MTSGHGVSLDGKVAAVLGVADESSIAWAIADALSRHGARVHVGYQQKFLSRVRLLLRDRPELEGRRCDVLDDDELAAFFDPFRESGLDVLVHAVAYGAPETFTSPPSGVGREAFSATLGVSAHSLARVAGFAKPHLREWGSVIALTFQASDRALPMYGTMGVAKSALESLVRYLAVELGSAKVRVNAISPGPIETLAALGIMLAFAREPDSLARQRGSLVEDAMAAAAAEGATPDDDLAYAGTVWRHVVDEFARRSPIDDTVSNEDVAGCALFLASDLARKITGQVLHVDCGFSTALLL
jgi:enoyl-[acyl-carrier protein] reductase I